MTGNRAIQPAGKPTRIQKDVAASLLDSELQYGHRDAPRAESIRSILRYGYD